MPKVKLSSARDVYPVGCEPFHSHQARTINHGDRSLHRTLSIDLVFSLYLSYQRKASLLAAPFRMLMVVYVYPRTSVGRDFHSFVCQLELYPLTSLCLCLYVGAHASKLMFVA